MTLDCFILSIFVFLYKLRSSAIKGHFCWILLSNIILTSLSSDSLGFSAFAVSSNACASLLFFCFPGLPHKPVIVSRFPVSRFPVFAIRFGRPFVSVSCFRFSAITYPTQIPDFSVFFISRFRFWGSPYACEKFFCALLFFEKPRSGIRITCTSVSPFLFCAYIITHPYSFCKIAFCTKFKICSLCKALNFTKGIDIQNHF